VTSAPLKNRGTTVTLLAQLQPDTVEGTRPYVILLVRPGIRDGDIGAYKDSALGLQL